MLDNSQPRQPHLRSLVALQRFARETLAVSLFLTLVLVPLTVLLDLSQLIRSGAEPIALIGLGACAGSLGVLTAALLALPARVLFAISTALYARSSALGRAWPLPAGLTLGALAWASLDPPAHSASAIFAAVAGLTFALGVASAWLSVRRDAPAARAALWLLAGASIAADQFVTSQTYPELHDVTELIAVFALLAFGYPIGARLLHARAHWLLVAQVVLLGLAIGCVARLDQLLPGFRSLAANESRSSLRAARLGRVLWDRDGDGYSPVLFGGDCDDRDPLRYPGAIDEPGRGDENCNGVDPSARPSPQALGIAARAGHPALPAAAIDLLLVLSIDTLRADALTAERMPKLWRFSQRGLRFTRFYAAGSMTTISMKLIHHAHDAQVSVMSELAQRGVPVTIVTTIGPLSGVANAKEITVRADAATVTNTTLAELARLPAGRHVVWGHYFDLHGRTAPARYRSASSARGAWAAYERSLHYVDDELDRVLQWLAASGRAERTLVVITGDHGEGLGAHGIETHSRTGFDEIIHTLAVMVGPGVPALEYTQLASHRDLPATFAGAFGFEDLAQQNERPGVSLLRLVDDPSQRLHDFVVTRSARFSSGKLISSPLAALVDERYKLVTGIEDGLVELYDLRLDPHEQHNLVSRSPDLARTLGRKLALFCDIDRYPGSRDYHSQLEQAGER